MRMRIPHAPQPDLPDMPPPDASQALAQPFVALAAARRDIAAGLPQGLFAVAYDPDRFAAGETLLADVEPAVLVPGFLAAAEKLLPAMTGIFPALSREAGTLGQFLAQGPRLAGALVAAFFTDAAEDFQALGAEMGIRPETLLFLTQEIVATVLRAEAPGIAALADDALWRKSHCPVCGSAPDLGLLKEQPEPSEFLIAKAGRLMLHCSLCGHLWRFPRLTCPTCGETDHEKLELFMPEGRARERIHACTTCRRYFVVTNRVDSDLAFDPDALGPALAHLDAAARERGYEPVCVMPWNQFEAS
ncbi:formate dehydrogenase accessory protein FdhE [Solidesulfovibrio carbinolicus]|uniref:Formate dehydrogenase accessory protein FdhE n=1 Tax=Solidesulfovibrio carbinolicus TaxID=296842 RepID=A0A4V0YR15_9BACT|nr:formate dehydrogenase accessory protein FdhE [Solidesulfovibrio carbinolicus]QAZ68222.1 formate dehydrogenase accessory protein FdhE [Solidesulfovibrio carbinolicus]